MAMTDTRPASETESATPTTSETAGRPRPAGGLAGLLGTGRHRSLGRLWIGASLVFLVVSGAVGAVLGAERLKPEAYNILDKDNFAQALSLHGVAGVWLFAFPMFIGLATIIVPRQIGAQTIAFPRAAALAFWSYLVGGSLLVVSYLINGGPFGGSANGVDLWIVSLAMVVVSLVLALVCIATTALALRTPGLSLERAPLFTWSMLVASAIWMASFGVLFGLLVFFYVDIHYGIGSTVTPDNLADWMRWTVTQPQVYAAAIPVLGFVADVVPVAGRTRPKHYGVQLFAIGLFGALSFGAWTFFQLAEPLLREQVLYIAFAFAILLPLLIITGSVVATLKAGRVRLMSPLLFAVSALLMLLAGAGVGALRVIRSFELVGTTADSSVMHYVFGAVVIAAVGAIHYWWPQVLTRPLKEGLGLLTGGLLLIGVVMLALPDIISGFLDQPAGSLVTTAPADSIKLLNAISFGGGLVVLLAVVVFIVNLAVSLGQVSGGDVDDPWEGNTLEWTRAPESITVTSNSPLLDAREAEVGG
jgi:cytochrome c oxidase subunit 1